MRKVIMSACAVLLGLLVCVSSIDNAEAQQNGPQHGIPYGKGAGSTGFDFVSPGTVRGRPLVSGDTTHAPAIATGPDYYASNMGVTCDGSTNDVSAINAALVSINGAGGGVLNLPAGTCIVGGTSIRVKKNVRLKGAGINATTLKLLASHSGAVVLLGESTGADSGNHAVSDLTVDGNGFCPVGCALISAASGDSGLMENVDIRRTNVIGFDWIAIALTGVSKFWVEDNICTKTIIGNTQNECLNVAEPVSALVASRYGRVKGNIFVNSAMSVNGHDMIVENNTVKGFGFGCGWGDGSSVYNYNNIIIGNDFSGGTGLDSNSLPACGVESWGSNNIIANNTLHSNAGVGLSFGGWGTIVSGNTVFDNGIYTGPFAQRVGIVSRWVSAIPNETGSYSIVFGNKSFNTTGALGTQLYGYYEGPGNTGITLGVNDFETNATSSVQALGTDSYAKLYTSPVIPNGVTMAYSQRDPGGTIRSLLFRFTDDVTYVDGGSQGFKMRVNNGSASAITGYVSQQVSFDGYTTAGVLSNNAVGLVATLSGTDGQILRLSGTTYAFGSINLAASAAVGTSRLAYANLAQGSALSVLGVTGNATADVASIAAGTDGNILRRSGTTLAFGSIDLSAAGAVGSSRLALANIAQIATNTVLGNATSGTANVAAQSMPSCSTSGSALKWTTNTGFGCNSSIDAATLGGATFASPGAIGGTSASTGAFTSVTLTSSLTLNNNQYIYAKDTSNNLVPIFLLYSDDNLYIGNSRGQSVFRAGTGGVADTYIVLEPTTATIQLAKTILTNENINFNVAAKTIVFKQGSNGSTGTFTCVSSSNVTVNNTSIAAGDTILMSWRSGTGSTTPPTVNQLTASTSFRVACASGDTAVYSYKIFRDAAWLLNRDLGPDNDNSPVGLAKVG